MCADRSVSFPPRVCVRYAGWATPYYKESHRKFRAALRAFVDKEIAPFTFEWDEAKAMPKSLFKTCADAGWLAGVVGPPWRTEFAGDKLAGGIRPEEFDAFHEQIILEEVSRAGSAGVVWGLFAGLSIGLPPILHFGNDAQRKLVCGPTLMGTKVICLAITEPSAGSDVANLKTTAVKTADGKHYIINGEKKW